MTKYEILFCSGYISDATMDKVNKAIHEIFGNNANIDWRDNITVWVETSEVIIERRE